MGALLRLAMIVGVLVIVFMVLPEGNGPVASTRQKAGQQLGVAAESARRALTAGEAEAIGRELRETGRVVRRRSAHAARTLAEATEDMRTTAAIEAQYVMDPRLSALSIDVDTHSGVVTLAGRVDSANDVAHAIDLAMRHGNVREVISTLQVVRPVADAQPRVHTQ
jgi:hyperosmotically inducible periplasmic protein